MPPKSKTDATELNEALAPETAEQSEATIHLAAPSPGVDIEALKAQTEAKKFPGIDVEAETAAVKRDGQVDLLNVLATKSAEVSWENVGTYGVDGEMLVTLRMSVKEYNTLREILTALRGEYKDTL